jgi:hypothetical protein
VIYIDKNGKVTQNFVGKDKGTDVSGIQMTQEGKIIPDGKLKLHDQRYIWVLVFADVYVNATSNTTTASATKNPFPFPKAVSIASSQALSMAASAAVSGISSPIIISLVSLQKYIGAGESLLSSLVASKSNVTEPGQLADQASSITLGELSIPVTTSGTPVPNNSTQGKTISCSVTIHTVYSGLTRFALGPRTLNRVSAFIPDNLSNLFPGIPSNPGYPKVVSNNFGNADGTLFGVSFMAGSFHDPNNQGAFRLGSDISVVPFIDAHLFILPPEQPFNAGSLSWYFATTFPFTSSFSAFTGLTIGLGDLLGPITEDLGLSFGGGLYQNLSSGSTNTQYQPRLIYGLNYFL